MPPPSTRSLAGAAVHSTNKPEFLATWLARHEHATVFVTLDSLPRIEQTQHTRAPAPTFDTAEEAIALANSTPYGLAAGRQASDLARATAWPHAWMPASSGSMTGPCSTLPFGGVKQSGYGRESGPEALQSYTRTKSVVLPRLNLLRPSQGM